MENRVIILTIGDRDLLVFLRSPGTSVVPRYQFTVDSLLKETGVSKIPDDVAVESVWNDPCRRSWMIRLRHSSFELVPEGQCPPIINGHIEPLFEDVDELASPLDPRRKDAT